MTSKNPTAAAKAVLASLCASASVLPQQLVTPNPKKLEHAGNLLLGMRVKRFGGVGGTRPKAGTNLVGTSVITPWAAAKRFAERLGVHMPKQSDAERSRAVGAKKRRPGKRKKRT